MHNEDIFANTANRSGGSTMYSYWDMRPDKMLIRKVFFLPKLPNFWVNLNFDFLLHNFSKYVNCPKRLKLSTCKILGDMARTREALRLDGRTDIHEAKTYICLPQGETYNYMSPPAGDIYRSSLRVCPSVRLAVRPCVTLSCPSHISHSLSCKNLKIFPQLTYLLKLCNETSKFNFAKKC